MMFVSMSGGVYTRQCRESSNKYMVCGMWDKAIFLRNIDSLVAEQCGGVQQKFNDKIGKRQAITDWKNEEIDKRPSVDTLLDIKK